MPAGAILGNEVYPQPLSGAIQDILATWPVRFVA
jgi:hypothetical protein